MSYEYTITINSGEKISDIIKQIEVLSIGQGFSCFKENEVLYIKDPSILSSWKYDVFVFLSNFKMELSLVAWSQGLYDVFKSTISSLDYIILDDDIGERITLEQIFRID